MTRETGHDGFVGPVDLPGGAWCHIAGSDRLYPAIGSRCAPISLFVGPRVLWRLVYLDVVVAVCGCSWLFWLTSATQAASCSAGVRMPMAECGRVVLNQWTHSAVASSTASMSCQRPWPKDELGLVQGVQRLGQGKAERNRPWNLQRRLPRSRPGRPRNGWTCTARRGRKWCTRPERSAPVRLRC